MAAVKRCGLFLASPININPTTATIKGIVNANAFM